MIFIELEGAHNLKNSLSLIWIILNLQFKTFEKQNDK